MPDKIKPYLELGIGVVIAVLILIVGFLVLVNPVRSKATEIEDEITITETQIQQERMRLAQLQEFQKDPEVFLRQIEDFNQKIPDKCDLADAIQQIDHAAEEGGLDFYAFTPQLPTNMGNYYSVTINLTFHGRYFNLVEFFNHVERLPRTFKVINLDLQANDDTLPYLQAMMDVKFFFRGSDIEGLPVDVDSPNATGNGEIAPAE